MTVPPPGMSRRYVPVRLLVAVPSVGAAGLVLYAAQFGRVDFLTVVGVGLLTAVAAMFAGGLLGLLFGIPRSAGGDQPAETAPPPGAAYVANTNLEQISDWLTKILVGVGLVQLGSITRGVGRLTGFLATGLGDRPSSRVLALALLVFFSVWGFIVGYMFARTYLPGLFRVADESALRVQVLAVRRELAEARDRADAQEDHDVLALSLTGRILAGGGTGDAVTQQELTDAYAQASRPVLVQIFNQAQTLRATTWRDRKPVMERVVPVFRALAANDAGHRFHRHFAQLGFALAEQQQPDDAGALAALDEAIRIRDAAGDRGWPLYEMVRAKSRIRLDGDFAAGRRSSTATRELVLADLRVAARTPWLRSVLRDADPYRTWTTLNAVDVATL